MTLRRSIPFWAKKVGGGELGYTPPLDVYGGAGFAVSNARLLRTGYTGPLMRLNFLSSIADINPLATGLLDIDTILDLNSVTYRGATAITSYDQSGFDRHVSTALETDSGPYLITDGLGVPENSIFQYAGIFPCLRSSGSNFTLFNTSPFMYASGSCSIFAVIQSDSPASSATLVGEGRSVTNTPAYLPILRDSDNAVNTAAFIRNDANSIRLTSSLETSNGFNNNLNIVSMIDTGSQLTGWVNGVVGTTQPYTRSGSITLDRFSIFGWRATGELSRFKGRIVELIIYPSDKTADRAGIESLLNSFYSFY